MYVKEYDQTHGSDVYFCNKKIRNIWMSFRSSAWNRKLILGCVPKARHGIYRKLISKTVLFVNIHLIIMAKSTISYIKTLLDIVFQTTESSPIQSWRGTCVNFVSMSSKKTSILFLTVGSPNGSQALLQFSTFQTFSTPYVLLFYTPIFKGLKYRPICATS